MLRRNLLALEQTTPCNNCGAGWWTPRGMVIEFCDDCPDDDDLTTDDTPLDAALAFWREQVKPNAGLFVFLAALWVAIGAGIGSLIWMGWAR